MVLIAVGEGGNFLSYGFAPASVVAPLGTVVSGPLTSLFLKTIENLIYDVRADTYCQALIANCIFAPLILRERFHAKELIGMGLAIVGAVTVVYSSNASNPRVSDQFSSDVPLFPLPTTDVRTAPQTQICDNGQNGADILRVLQLDPEGLVIAIRQIPFIVYTCINLAFMILLSVLSPYPRFGGRYIAIDVGVCALFGGYTVLSTKALSSLLSTIFLTAFASWITWVLVLVLVVTSVLQVKFLNRALMRFQSKVCASYHICPSPFPVFHRDYSYSRTSNGVRRKSP